MKKHLLTALSLVSLVTLSGCWNGCCDKKEAAPVETSVAVSESVVTETSVADAVETAVSEVPAPEETKL